MHREAERLVERAQYQPFISREIVRSQIRFLRHRPMAYVRALLDVVRGTFGSRNFLLGGLAIFPKVAHMARLMETSGVTHVHCHFANHPALAGFIIRRLTGIPYSFTAHGSDLHVDRHMLCTKVREAAFVVAISDFNRAVIVEECGERVRSRLEMIHTGVDVTHFRPAPTQHRNGPLVIVCVGTLHEVKGQTHLVEACRQIAEAGIDFRCHFVGSGPDRESLQRQIAAAGLTAHIILDGELDRTALAERLREADVLVAPSVPTRQGKREGIPVVLMEAMASGLPVIASRLSGIPELVEHERSGLLVDPGNPVALADALSRLAADPQLRSLLAEEGRRRVESEFDIRLNARKLAAMFTASRGSDAPMPAAVSTERPA
jgi:colanic acid/amylovoran biosynthesis glycosyltransferase